MSPAENDDGFDFIIVGSGAGGAPLAARLAQAGKRVLVIEAGSDHGKEGALEPANEVSRVPILSGVSTEHEALSWRFFVDHYRRRSNNQLPDGIDEDPKWHKSSDEQQNGIFYPRASSVGGCTIHNAMITIAGPDSDWDDLADELQDDSWRADCMRTYFQRLEHNDYMPRPASEQRTTLAMQLQYVRDSFWWLLGYRPDSTGGKHGFDGWLHTSVPDISLGLGDKQLLRMLKAALLQAKADGLENAWTLVRRFIKGEISSALDPNHQRTQRESPEGVVMIPTSIYGAGTTIHQNRQTPYAMLGRRSSPRELLYEAQVTCSERLTIWTDCLVTELIMDPSAEDSNGQPRAVGVRFLRGKKLYKAHVNPNQPPSSKEEVRVKPGGEIILCGGVFNTPQLLMLSGIGDKAKLDQLGIHCRVHSPGVGRNLQDRYEVSLVGQMKKNFTVLHRATIRLPEEKDNPDPLLRQWREEGTGLYASNGAVLAIMKRSRPDLAQPDLFIFGVPVEFRGYAVGYSVVRHFDRFTWVILKSHTGNRDGEVTLRSTNPLDTPKINFNSFNSSSRSDGGESDPDVLAIAEGVKFVKNIFKRAGQSLVTEIHPGISDHNSDAINRWIRSQAWGHHACGTCRMGRAGDPYAVLDSQFRLRGVDGLRVVDASIFPKIPGYFIVTNLYMASEKAAQVILDSSKPSSGALSHAYPHDLFELECEAIKTRRQQLVPSTSAPETVQASCASSWDDSVTGLALSGGGIRSATFSLGILQSLARHSLLRKVDFLSTVSGGGYIGSCIGRLYDRLRPTASTSTVATQQAASAVENELTDVDSPLVDWLRRHGNYIAPQGSGDGRLNFAIFLRNILSVHLVIGLLIFTFFGIANIIRYELFDKVLATSAFAISRTDFPIGHLISSTLGPFFSPWFILVELLLLFLVLPRIIGYWIVSQDQHEAFKRAPLVMLFLVAGVLLLIGVDGALRFEPLIIGVGMLTSLLQVELAWHRGRHREEAMGTGGTETQRLRTRNFLTYDLGLGLALVGGALVFALVDTAGHALQELKIAGNPVYARTFAALGAGIAAALPITRWLAGKLAEANAQVPSTVVRILKRDIAAGALAALLFTLPLVLYSFAAHAAFEGGAQSLRGIAITALALVLTVILAFPSALSFVNRSSLAQTYSARLARAYLGASNPLRRRAEGQNVTEVISGDDVASIRDYRPHEASGPLHIINVTVNQTVDSGSRTRKRDRQGENMAVTCLGISVGEYWHSKWNGPKSVDGKRKVPSRLEPLGLNPGQTHPLVDQLNRPASRVEMLSLRQWMGISGAAVDPGRGRNTNLGMALLMGMVNLRTGYWWDTGIPESARDGFPDLSPLRRFLYLVPRYLTTQFLLLFEWIARYPGPWERFWHLSDGGYFENTGGYELVRRQLPRIIMCDGSADPTCQLESFADFVRKVRIDFGATVESFTVADINQFVPEAVRGHVGTADQLKLKKSADDQWLQRPERNAALFWITYASRPGYRSVLLYIKANLVGDEPVDVQQYSRAAPDFPHEDTADQFFDEAQWESYRKLGEHIAHPLFSHSGWFWAIQTTS